MHEPFVLYGGRIDPGKGCEELLEYFQTYVRENGDATLMLMGVKMMPIPEDPHVRFAGVLPDEERLHALEAATVVVVPSPHESLSLLALEAMAVGTPVLVNARSEVLVEHCRQSNAGLCYADRWEFTEALKLLMRDADLRAALGRNGKQYVNRHYRWSHILRKYERLFTRLAGPGAEAPRSSTSARANRSVARVIRGPVPIPATIGGDEGAEIVDTERGARRHGEFFECEPACRSEDRRVPRLRRPCPRDGSVLSSPRTSSVECRTASSFRSASSA